MGLAQSTAACSTNPAFTASWYSAWKANTPTELQTLLGTLESNTATETSGAMGFCVNNTVFTTSCCTNTTLYNIGKYMHERYKPFMKKGTPGCEQMTNMDKRLPKKCLKATIGQASGPPKAPGNATLKELKERYGGNETVANTMENASKAMTGIVNGVMGMMRTLTCSICAGPTDFTNIYDGGNIKLNDANMTIFLANMTEHVYRMRKAEENCTKLSEEMVDNLTDATKPGCSGAKQIAKGRKKSDRPGKCSSNATCGAILSKSSFGLNSASNLLEGANLDNTTVTDQSGSTTRMLSEFRMLQTSTVTTSGGASITTTGSDDETSYGGVDASFGAMAAISLGLVALLH